MIRDVLLGGREEVSQLIRLELPKVGKKYTTMCVHQSKSHILGGIWDLAEVGNVIWLTLSGPIYSRQLSGLEQRRFRAQEMVEVAFISFSCFSVSQQPCSPPPSKSLFEVLKRGGRGGIAHPLIFCTQIQLNLQHTNFGSLTSSLTWFLFMRHALNIVLEVYQQAFLFRLILSFHLFLHLFPHQHLLQAIVSLL